METEAASLEGQPAMIEEAADIRLRSRTKSSYCTCSTFPGNTASQWSISDR